MTTLTAGSDAEARKYFRILAHVDKHYASLADELDVIHAKDQKNSKRKMEFLEHLREYGEDESDGIKKALSVVTDCLEDVEEMRRAMINQHTERVVDVLRSYKLQCRKMKDEVHGRERTKQEQVHKQQKLDRIQSSSTGRRTEHIRSAQIQVAGATAGARRAEQELLGHMIAFEKRKLAELKKSCRDMLTSQMVFFARGLEVCSEAYKALDHMNEAEDLKELNMMRRNSRVGDEGLVVASTHSLGAPATSAPAPLAQSSAFLEQSRSLGYPPPSMPRHESVTPL